MNPLGRKYPIIKQTRQWISLFSQLLCMVVVFLGKIFKVHRDIITGACTHTYRITTTQSLHQGVLKLEGFLSFYLLTFIQALITLYSCMTCFFLSLDYQLIPKEQTVFLPVFLWQVVPSLPSYAVSAHINNPTTALPVMEAGLSSLKSTGADENRHAKC